MFDVRRLFAAWLALAPGLGLALEPHDFRKPEEVVAWLYRDFAWEAVLSMQFKGEGFIDQPREVLERYLVGDLAALIVKDRECARRTREVCKLDFHPLFASSDPGAADLEIKAIRSQLVHVRFRYPGNGERVEVDYGVVYTVAGWRVNDIHYKGKPSLKSLLTGGR